MKSSKAVFVFLWLAAASGCGTSPNHTHRGDLLDDQVTTQRVQAALNRGGPDYKNIQTTATNGVVTLTGTVATAENRTRAENIARSVHRGMKLENNVQVPPPN